MRFLLLFCLLSSLTAGHPHKRFRKHPIQTGDSKFLREAVPSEGIAQKAAEEAKAAHAAQNAAGAEAARVVKSRLAEKALQAAKAAEVALSGKRALVDQLQLEVKEAAEGVEKNTAAVKLQEETVNAAAQSVQLAIIQRKQILQVLQLAEKLEKSAQCVLEKTKSGLHEKCRHLNEAKNRLSMMRQKLHQALLELSETKKAAECALASAKAACGNVRRKRRRVNRKALRHKRGKT